MGTVLFDISMSLDGFIAGPEEDGAAGELAPIERLHDWIFADGPDRYPEILEELLAASGAMVAGRRTHDIVNGWNGEPPITPCFVVSHDVPPQEASRSGWSPFTFVTEGVKSAVAQAKTAAGHRDVYVLGGAITAQQCLKAGLVDELQIHLVPVLLGSGIRLFDDPGAQRTELQIARAIGSPRATHLRYRVAH